MGGWGLKVARGDRDRNKERDQLREKLLQQNRTLEQIATAMARQFGDRPRPAWRHAHGWTQQDVAERYNCEVKDSNASMTAHRISDFERWPINKTGTKPTIPTLGVLARIYGTKVSKLIDHHDRQKMSNAELITCAILDSGITPQQLPATIHNFVGRARELDILTAQLDRMVNDSSSGPVVITAIGGTAGIGKTTLALYWTRHHSNHFPDGQLYVDLRGFSPTGTPVTPQEAIRGFLDAFQVPPDKIPANFDDQASLYRTLVADRRLVIVLDNARDADQVRPLLPGSPSCLVLVTSRQQLASLIAREHATQIILDFLTTEESRQLLIDFLGAERIQPEPDVVEELIHRCVRLPTALNIAAARIQAEPHTSLNVLVGQLREQRQRLTALSTGDSYLTDIRAVFSWSYTALSPETARLFRLLGLHSGPDIDTQAAASLAGLAEPGELLTELTRAHLLKEHIPGRYQFHDLLRVYASELATTEEPEAQRQAALNRVLDYYLHTGFTANRHISPHRDPITLQTAQPGAIPDQITNHGQAVEWFSAERAVLLAATNYAAVHGFDTHAWQLPWALATFLSRQGHWHDLVATQQTSLAATSRLSDRTAQALAHRDLGNAYVQLEHHTDALTNLQQALTLYKELGDHDGQTHTHLALGWAYERQHQYDQALTHAQHALTLSRATGHDVGQARAVNNVGWYYALLGQYQQALIHCQQALNLNRKLGDHYAEAATLDSLGYAHHHLGHHDQAIIHYQQSIALFRDFGDRYFEARALMKLGDTYHATGNTAAARDSWQQALVIFDDLGHSNADTVRTKLAKLNIRTDEPTPE